MELGLDYLISRNEKSMDARKEKQRGKDGKNNILREELEVEVTTNYIASHRKLVPLEVRISPLSFIANMIPR